jgi:hypothetical protein
MRNSFSYWTLLRKIDEETSSRRRALFASVRARAELRRRVEQLEDDAARMALLTLSLAELCVAKGVITEDELAARMREIDLRDGVEDGKSSTGSA